jgi:hypothetical protein
MPRRWIVPLADRSGAPQAKLSADSGWRIAASPAEHRYCGSRIANTGPGRVSNYHVVGIARHVNVGAMPAIRPHGRTHRAASCRIGACAERHRLVVGTLCHAKSCYGWRWSARRRSRPDWAMKSPPGEPAGILGVSVTAVSGRAVYVARRSTQLVVDRARCSVHPKLLGQGRGRPRAGRRYGGDRDGGADSDNRSDRGVRNLSKHDDAPSVLCWRLCHDLNMGAFRGRFRDEHHITR